MENLLQHLWVGLAGGLLAFAHCLGMCGGFVLHLSLEQKGTRTALLQLLWVTGKLFSYLFLGTVAGYLGGSLEGLFFRHGLFQNLLSYLTGGVILMMGLSLLGLLPVRPAKQGHAWEGLLTMLGSKFTATSNPGSALTLGLLTGFLPCPIVVAFLAYSLQSGAALQGMLTMGGLGLGTALPLLMFGAVSRLSRVHLRSWAPKAGGIILILLGLSTALRGTTAYHQLLGCPSKPAGQQVPLSTAKPCCPGESK